MKMWFLILLCPVSSFAMETYTFQVDLSSFTDKELSSFKTMGSVNDSDPFRQTYLLDNSSYYMTLKITPKDDIEKAVLLSNVGQGFEVLGVYNKSQTLEVKEEHSNELPKVKSTPPIKKGG